ncbi:hypothetical protein AB0M46_31520 [Dactylosporangium sp. NPDC051485]|uniref:hypothetical protein n=1 Tax=Dactylosporangium sp. NPDC051485 TaxID=3154846 RepID=UPI0034224C1C
MGTATVEVSGAQATQWAAELHAVLTANAAPGDSVSPVEVERSAAIVIAVIGLVFSGVGTAKTLWDWWYARRRDGGTVKILFSDGTSIALSDISQEQLEIVFQQAETPQR